MSTYQLAWHTIKKIKPHQQLHNQEVMQHWDTCFPNEAHLHLPDVECLHPQNNRMATCNMLHSKSQSSRPGSVCSAGNMQDGGRLWQPYTDFLVTSALLAVPWGGPEMAESAPNDVQQLLASARSYQQARPRQTQQALRPLPSLDTASPEDLAARCDSGSTSRLIHVRTGLL